MSPGILSSCWVLGKQSPTKVLEAEGQKVTEEGAVELGHEHPTSHFKSLTKT